MKNNIGSFSLIKKINTALILNMIRTKGKVSRIEIARESGLTAATVTNITADLLDGGIIEECSVGTSTGGRKPVMLKLCTNLMCVGSAYISPHGVEVCVADFDANIIFRQNTDFTNFEPSPELCTDYISEVLMTFCENSGRKMVGISLGLHGVADSDRGLLINAPNLGWKKVMIGEMLREKCAIDVYVQNDVRLMAKAEMNFGVAKNIEDFVYFYIGSGVGAAVVSGGELLKGSNNAAGELGHTVTDPAGPICKCGTRGCLQALIGEDAMYGRLAEKLSPDSLLTKDSTCSDILKSYIDNKDKISSEIVEEEIKYLSVGLSNIINIFNPDMIVIGSGIEYFEEAVVKSLLHRNIRGAADEIVCEILYSELGSDAVILGGVASVLEKVCDNPYELLMG